VSWLKVTVLMGSMPASSLKGSLTHLHAARVTYATSRGRAFAPADPEHHRGSNDQGVVGHRVQNAGPPFDDEHLGSRCSALPGG
jgi:hypothetical protein